MDSDGTRCAEIAETTSFLHYFSELPDHRQAGKVDYPLPEVLLLILLAVLAGAEAFTDIARFGERKIELLRRFRPYVNGTPSHDHLGDIFATLDARAFQLCFVALGRGADQHARRGHRDRCDRWQDVAAFLPGEGLER